MTMYSKFLEMSMGGGVGEIQTKGARLFRDYQNLMRIWTHPWVLKLDEIRQENKVCSYMISSLNDTGIHKKSLKKR